ncbi:YccF domain-containing protein, partial [Bifidobacterium sp. UBA4282]
MRLLGNILWILLGGLFIAIGWALVGLVLCITIIGIP